MRINPINAAPYIRRDIPAGLKPKKERKNMENINKKEELRCYVASFSDNRRIPFATNFQTQLPVIRIREMIKTLRENMPELKGEILSGYTPISKTALENRFHKKPEQLPRIICTRKGVQTNWEYIFDPEKTFRAGKEN